MPDIGVCGGVQSGMVPGTPIPGTALMAGTRELASFVDGMYEDWVATLLVLIERVGDAGRAGAKVEGEAGNLVDAGGGPADDGEGRLT